MNEAVNGVSAAMLHKDVCDCILDAGDSHRRGPKVTHVECEETDRTRGQIEFSEPLCFCSEQTYEEEKVAFERKYSQATHLLGLILF